MMRIDQYPVEVMKQQIRIDVIERVLQQIDYNDALVVGCGQGRELNIINAERLVAFDLALIGVQKAQYFLPENDYLQADGMALPFADNSFDLVVSSEVIEHILEPQRFVKEIARVLRPGGYLLLTTPNWQSFFGVARWLGEKILRRPVTSDDQPVDNWFTSAKLKDLCLLADLSPNIESGAWYFPPTGLGDTRLPDALMAKLFSLLMPIEQWLQRTLPSLGHMLVLVTRLQDEST